MFSGVATRVLGIDPGLSRCGYGLVEHTPDGLRAAAAGVIRTPADHPVPERLLALADDLELLYAELQPDAVAVERVLFQVNARTAMSVGQASGLAVVAAARRGVTVAEYSPNEVKQAVAGYGGADKAQVQAMVQALLGLAEAPKPPDVADALALALCHVTAGRLQAAVERTGTQGPPGHPAGSGRVRGLDRAIAAALAREGEG